MASNSLGVNVALPTGTASEYQRRRERELERRRRGNAGTDDEPPANIVVSRSEESSDGSDDDDHQEECKGPRPIGIDLDQEIVPFRPADDDADQSSDVSSDDASSDDGREDDQNYDAYPEDEDEDEDDDISESPPVSMPLLVIDLEGLTGCKPSTQEEKEILVDQVREALLGPSSVQSKEESKDDDGDNVGSNDTDEAEQWLDFTDRSAELFDMGAASHCDTSSMGPGTDNDLLGYAIIEYPEFLTVPTTDSNEQQADASANVMATSRIWKVLTSPHRIPVVDRVLTHLSESSRDIVWKYQMNAELRLMAKTEEMEQKRRQRSAELEEWTLGRRKLELERLYQVRETFEFRLNAARRNLDEVVEAREGRVRAELARKREAGESGGGVDGLDWAEGAATFVFGDEAAGKMNTSSSLQDDNEFSNPYESDQSGYELEGEDSGVDSASDRDEFAKDDAKVIEKLPQSQPEATAERRRNRAARSSKRMRKRLARQEEEAKRRAMIEAAKAEERSIREICTLPEEQRAKAVVDQLEERMAKVDDLLEQIQEEEWAEEEGEGDMVEAINRLQIDVVYDNLDMERHHRPLLDQILAMILGAARPSEGQSKEEHYQFIRDEHQAIVMDWRNHFGRLPPSLSEQEDAAGSPTGKDTSTSAEADEMLVAGALTALRVDSCNEAASSSASNQVGVDKTPEAMRTMLGFSDNADDNWEDVADWDEFLPGVGDNTNNTGSVEPKQQPAKKVGLRPGGKI